MRMKFFRTEILVTIIFFILLIGCKKENTTNNPNNQTAPLLDSVISINLVNPEVTWGLHFEYDSQRRIIREDKINRFKLTEFYTYDYEDINSTHPFQRKRFDVYAMTIQASTFRYDNNGRKIYDSTYFISPTVPGYQLTKIDYSSPRLITVNHFTSDNQESTLSKIDTLYLSNNGMYDSIRVYARHQPGQLNPDSIVHWWTYKFAVANIPQSNFFQSLSIFNSAFYATQSGYWPENANYYDITYPVLNYLGTKYFAQVNRTGYNVNIYTETSFKYEFAANNYPISETLHRNIDGYRDSIKYQFVYLQP